MEQKCYMKGTGILYPNMYCILVGPPGAGKTRSIERVRKYLATLAGTETSQGLRIAPTSMTAASLVDALCASKRILIIFKQPAQEFHSMVMLPDEWGAAFSTQYDDDFIGNLTTFYDVVVPYSQWRRGGDVRINIPRPQVSILAGSTPSNIMRYIPVYAWDQGFCSRVMMVYNGEKKEPKDDFDPERKERELSTDMVKDLAIIFNLHGEFKVSQGFRDAVNSWRAGGEKPKPDHPRLEHYLTRRKAHLYKLAMVSSVDRDNSLEILEEDFNRALWWLELAELNMANIFDAGSSSVDSRAMDEIVSFVKRNGKIGVGQALTFTSKRVPQYAVYRVLDLLVHSGRLAFDQDTKTYRCCDG